MNGKLGEGGEVGREVGIGERRRWGEGREIFNEKLNWRRILERRRETTDAGGGCGGSSWGEKRRKRGITGGRRRMMFPPLPLSLHPPPPPPPRCSSLAAEKQREEQSGRAPGPRRLRSPALSLALQSSPLPIHWVHPSFIPPSVPQQSPLYPSVFIAPPLPPSVPPSIPPASLRQLSCCYSLQGRPSLSPSLPPSVHPSVSPFTWCWPSPPRVSARAGRRGGGVFQMDRL